MSVYFAQQRVDSVRKEIERQRSKQASEEKNAAAADAAALKAQQAAAKANSPASAASKLRTADSEATKAIRYREGAARASKAVAQATTKLHKAEQELARERTKEQKRADAKLQRTWDQAARDREAEDRLRQQREGARDREISRLQEHAADLEARLAAEPWATAPDAIRVLFIAASPENEDPLRLDKEVREIQRRMRETDYRDSVTFEVRLATQTTDLLQALNEVRPDVVHFSGHGDQEALIFEDSDGQAKPLHIEDLAQLLRISSDRIRLALFNSCNSAVAARSACNFIPFAIGMNEPVNDAYAQAFSGQFYNAIGFGRSIQEAFEQAIWQAKAAIGIESGKPALYAAPEVSSSLSYLVQPAA